MRRFDYAIGPQEAGRTVQDYLKHAHGYSSRTLVKLKHYPDGLLLNGAHIRTVDRMAEGDVLSVCLREVPSGLEPAAREVPLLYADEDVMVYDKPPAMPCHPSNGHYDDTLANVYAAYWAARGQSPAFRALNRLDSDTTGCVLTATNRHAAGLLTGNFEKSYIAIVGGTPQPPVGRVDAPIMRRDTEHMRDITRIVHPDGQPSATRYTVLAEGGGCSLVRFVLETGRTHQIRVHMSHIGHPLAGDAMYGGDCSVMQRQALHCESVSFCHPVSGEPITVQAPLPEDMKELLLHCGIDPAVLR